MLLVSSIFITILAQFIQKSSSFFDFCFHLLSNFLHLSMDFFSKFTKPAADHSKPASDGQEPTSTTEPSNTDLFGSAKVVAGAAQSYFSHQPPTYENAEVAGATADILGAASEYGKLDKTQGVGKYVDQAETYLKDYEASNTTTPAAAAPAAEDTADDAGVKSAPTVGGTETDSTAATKGDVASAVEPSKPESYGEEDTTEGLSIKPPAGDAPVETDKSDAYGEGKDDVLPEKTLGSGTATETDAGGDYTEAVGGGATTETDAADDYQKPKVDEYKETTEDGFAKKPEAAVADASEDYAKDTEDRIPVKPSSGGPAAGTDSGDSGYAEDTEEGLPKPSAGGYAAGDGASDKVGPAEGGFGNFTKVAGDFLNK